MAIFNRQYNQVNCCCVKLHLLMKLTMQSNENKRVPQEKTPVEDSITVSLEEYQKMKDVLEYMEREKA